uniref:Uncharacterized protein n=1 Tax=Amphiprion percula TaxID=161767 RepID=A0A3P8SSQ1_AMPPE
KSRALDLFSSTPQAYSHSSSGRHSLIRRVQIFPSFSKVYLDDKQRFLKALSLSIYQSDGNMFQTGKMRSGSVRDFKGKSFSLSSEQRNQLKDQSSETDDAIKRV